MDATNGCNVNEYPKSKNPSVSVNFGAFWCVLTKSAFQLFLYILTYVAQNALESLSFYQTFEGK